MPDDERPSPAVRDRDDTAPADIGAFYDREMPRLVLFVMTLSSSLDGHAAADVAQTAFERALPRWPSLHHPKAWLYRVAHREALARCAAIAREVPTSALPDQPDEIYTALNLAWRAEQREVMALLRRLAPKQREVMTWTLAGFSTAEIASALGLSTDAVKQNRAAARKSLRKHLAQKGDAP